MVLGRRSIGRTDVGDTHLLAPGAPPGRASSRQKNDVPLPSPSGTRPVRPSSSVALQDAHFALSDGHASGTLSSSVVRCQWSVAEQRWLPIHHGPRTTDSGPTHFPIRAPSSGRKPAVFPDKITLWCGAHFFHVESPTAFFPLPNAVFLDAFVGSCTFPRLRSFHHLAHLAADL